MPPAFRPVNIIQHDDAGPQEGQGIEPETIELPPAYNKIKSVPLHLRTELEQEPQPGQSTTTQPEQATGSEPPPEQTAGTS